MGQRELEWGLMKDVKTMTYDQLVQIMEGEYLITKIDPFSEVPQIVADAIIELQEREDKTMQEVAEFLGIEL